MLPPVKFERLSQVPLTQTAVREWVSSGQESERIVRGKVRLKYRSFGPYVNQWHIVIEGKDTKVLCQWTTRAPRGWELWEIGQDIALFGVVEEPEDTAAVPAPSAEQTASNADPAEEVAVAESPQPMIKLIGAEPVGIWGKGGGSRPVYQLGTVDDSELREVVARSLLLLKGRIADPLPAYLIDEQKLLRFEEALKDAHFPSNSAQRGIKRLGLQEALLFQLGRRIVEDIPEASNASSCNLSHEGIGRLSLMREIQLNDEQEVTFSDIRRDLIANRPMRRLMQGDVGSGKSLSVCSRRFQLLNPEGAYLCVIPLRAVNDATRFAEPLLLELGIKTELIPGALRRDHLDFLNRKAVLSLDHESFLRLSSRGFLSI